MATLGGITLYPKYGTEGHQAKLEFVGNRQVMADGSMVWDSVGYRHVFTLKMHGMTEAQKDAIKAKAVLTTTQTYVDPHGDSFTVVSDPGSWTERAFNNADGTYYFEADLTLYESSVT